MVNKVTLIGNLGRDAELRRLENGAAVAKFSIATNENYKDKAGEWQTLTEWHEVVVWRELAEQAERNCKKGTLVYVEGKITHRKYTDANNIERYATEIVGNYMRVLDRKEGGSAARETSFPNEEYAPARPKNTAPPMSDTSTRNVPMEVTNTSPDGGDDLPF